MGQYRHSLDQYTLTNNHDVMETFSLNRMYMWLQRGYLLGQRGAGNALGEIEVALPEHHRGTNGKPVQQCM